MEHGIEIKPSLPIQIDVEEIQGVKEEQDKDKIRCKRCSRLVNSLFKNGICIFCYRESEKENHGKIM